MRETRELRAQAQMHVDEKIKEDRAKELAPETGTVKLPVSAARGCDTAGAVTGGSAASGTTSGRAEGAGSPRNRSCGSTAGTESREARRTGEDGGSSGGSTARPENR